MTARGWWCLLSILLMLLVGLIQSVSTLMVTALALLVWFGWEWLFFALRVRSLRRSLYVEREVRDERGPVKTLWAGRKFTVRAALHLRGGKLPYVSVADPVPFGVQHEQGNTSVDGELHNSSPLRIEYEVYTPLTGAARFEGVRVETTDLQGFFAFVTFIRDPVVLRILPAVLVSKSGGPTLKRHNELPPPGIHRLRQPGSGAELLDLRDYLPGDPPRTIAWKVSARRDRLVTKEFESEVPVRCTLFLDTSSSVRVPSPNAEPISSKKRRGARRIAGPDYFKPLDRLVELAAGVIRAGASIRDLTGLCVFDEQSSQLVRPERTATHQNRLLQLLGDAASLAPVAPRANPETLTPIAYALAQEVYPDLLRPEVNHVPAWLTWLAAFPRYTRHPRTDRRLAPAENHHPSVVYNSRAAVAVPGERFRAVFRPDAGLGAGRSGLAFVHRLSADRRRRLGSVPVQLARVGQAKETDALAQRLAALFTLRHGPILGGVEALMQDDDLFALHVQQFLAEHQTPCFVPLYDDQGRYLFRSPEKVTVLARAVLQAAARGRDNELYVLMVDLLELDGCLEPLLQALRVALGRHHQVLIVCPWPQGVPLPEEESPRRRPRGDTLRGLITQLAFQQMHAAYGRIRQTFARLGVQVVCAGSDESIPLILKRLERIRGMGGRR